MLLKLAWRNIWRNGRRTAITVLALAMGVTAIVSINSVREVASEEMIRGLTKGLVGHVQVHGAGYQESPEMGNVVADADAVEAKILSALPGAQAEKRVLGAGLAGLGDASSAVLVMGIDPANPGARDLFKVEKGRALSTTKTTVDPPREAGLLPQHDQEALVGSGLADQLHLSVGGELILVGQAADGSIANDRFTVVGIGDAGSYEGNASAVFLKLGEAQSFFALNQGVHQVIIRLPTDEDDLTRPVSVLRGALSASEVEVLPWNEILPELKGAMDAKAKNQSFLQVIIFFIVSLGVLNTMTMSTFERTREFGVMASLGTRRRRILGMVVLEALLLGLIGFVVGVGLAAAILRGFGAVDFGAMVGGTDMMGARMPDALKLRVLPSAVAGAAVTTLVTMLAGSLIPAFRASRLQPVEATRYV